MNPDHNNWPGMIIPVCLAALGGFLHAVGRMFEADFTHHGWRSLLCQIPAWCYEAAASGFMGLLIALPLSYYQVPEELAWSLIGFSGFLGSKAVSRLYQKRIDHLIKKGLNQDESI